MVWDYIKDSLKCIIETPSNKVTPMCFTADGHYVLFGGKDRRVLRLEVGVT